MAQQPLWRVHREVHPTAHFATDSDGRFNPPTPTAGFGTWYLSTHRLGAFIEVFGRSAVVTRRQVNERVLAQVFLPSDLRLADLTNPAVVGQFGITNELSASGTLLYPLAQRWATALWQAGFSGVHYLSRFDASLETRSIAVFGKPGDEAEYESAATVWPLGDFADEMAAHFAKPIVAGRSL